MKSVPRSSSLFIILAASLVFAGCGGSGYGGNGMHQPPPDTTAPTVSAVQVPPGSSVNRIVTLSTTASDNTGVTEVRFFVDGALLGSVTAAPYSIDWDTGAETEGDHLVHAAAVDAAGNSAQSADITVTVRNVVQFAVTLSSEEEVPPATSPGSAQADLTVNLTTGELSGTLTASGITPTAAHVHDAFAGTNGAVLVPLDQDAGDPGLFTVPAGANLDATEVEHLLAGALYVNVHTAAAPGGELRGQILPEDFVLRFTQLEGIASVPRVDSAAGGFAAVTLNQATGTLVVEAQVTGLDDATQAHVHDAYAGDTGIVLVPLNQDLADAGHWFVEDGVLNAAGLDAFAAGRLYINIHSPAHPGGEIRGQILPAGISVLYTALTGAQEVPAIDTSATAFAALTLDESASLMTLHVNTAGLDDATASHLHSAYGGVNGPIAIGLVQDGTNPAHWFTEEQALDTAQMDALLAGATYVNVHTPAHAGGEVRGQVIPDGILFTAGRLDGSQVVPPVSTAAGGTFAVTVDPTAMTLVAHANTTGADDATLAHLHDGYAGVSGAVAIPLTQDAADVTHWSAEGIALTVDQLAAFAAGRLYVNVHTPANPGGEIRGQLAPAPVEVLFSTLGGDQEVPAVTSAASATAASTVDRGTGVITVHLHAIGADDATASHVHSGYAGQGGGVLVPLAQDAGDAGHWSVIEAQLDADGLADYLQGRLYVNLHTPANPGGEIRGQFAPRDIQVVIGELDGDQVVPPVVSAGGGHVAATTNLHMRSFVAFVNTVGADDATAAGIRVGGVGTNGAEILPLQQTPALVSQWSAMTESLAAADFSAYRAGRLYALVGTPANPDGELRGQIVPPDAASFDDLAPTVTLTSPGANVSGTVTLEADASDDQGVTEVRFLADGALIGGDTTAPYTVDWDTTAAANGPVTLTAEAEDLAGNVGVSAAVDVTVENAVPVSFADIQAQVFSPNCSGCHTGPTGGILPGGMNLSSKANSYAALVNVPSLEVSLDRVEPGNPDASYLIRKLEGGPGISGDRMPQGGPFLNQATIDMIRQWISDGAPNN
jgi:CHRD domain/Bacterial Ig domain